MAKEAAKSKRKLSTVAALSLIDVDIVVDPSLEEDPDKVELSFNVDITHPKKAEDGLYVFTADLQISKSEEASEMIGSGVTASYFCALKCENIDDTDILNSAKMFTRTSIWSNFISVVAVLTHQMRATFPSLPPMPGIVNVKEVDDLSATEALSAE